jgi:phenylalanyl-tRNA synthetase beta chain
VRLVKADEETVIGSLGQVAPKIAEAMGSRRRLYVAEIDFDRMAEAALPGRTYQGLSRFPAVKRDLAVLIPEDVLESQVRDVIISSGGPLVETVEVFDVYTGDQVPAGMKSLAYAIDFRSPERTLTEAEIDDLQRKIEKNLKSELGGSIRDK